MNPFRRRRDTRLICGSDKSFSERFTELDWSTLEPRRKYLCSVQLNKIIHGYSEMEYTTYVNLTGPTETRSEVTMKLKSGLEQQEQTVLNFHF